MSPGISPMSPGSSESLAIDNHWHRTRIWWNDICIRPLAFGQKLVFGLCLQSSLSLAWIIVYKKQQAPVLRYSEELQFLGWNRELLTTSSAPLKASTRVAWKNEATVPSLFPSFPFFLSVSLSFPSLGISGGAYYYADSRVHLPRNSHAFRSESLRPVLLHGFPE